MANMEKIFNHAEYSTNPEIVAQKRYYDNFIQGFRNGLYLIYEEYTRQLAKIQSLLPNPHHQQVGKIKNNLEIYAAENYDEKLVSMWSRNTTNLKINKTNIFNIYNGIKSNLEKKVENMRTQVSNDKSLDIPTSDLLNEFLNNLHPDNIINKVVQQQSKASPSQKQNNKTKSQLKNTLRQREPKSQEPPEEQSDVYSKLFQEQNQDLTVKEFINKYIDS